MLEFGRRLRHTWWRTSVPDEVDREVAFHLEMRTRDLVAQGMTPEAARIEALARLGDLNHFKATLTRLGQERDRMRSRHEWLDELRQDIGYAWRSLVKQPAFTLIAVTTLGLGIGATTAIFSVIYSVVLRPLAIEDPDRVMLIADGNDLWGGAGSVSVGNYAEYKRDSRAFSVMGALFWTGVNLSTDGIPERVVAARADRDFFAVMGRAPSLGRVFSADEDQPGAAPVVLISDKLWRRRFGADRAIVGRTISLNGGNAPVIGVMPPDFGWGAEELWTPAAFSAKQLAEHDGHFLTVYGRLKAATTPKTALGELDITARRIAATYPNENRGLYGSMQPMFTQLVGSAPARLWIVFGAVAAVLLIGCVNVANLLLARGATRERELAVRAALGAGRRRIIRQLVTENLVLALAAGGLGVALAAAALPLLIAAAPPGIPRLGETRIGWPVLAFALVVSLVSTVIFGLLPAIRTANPSLVDALREGTRGSSTGGREWVRRGLVAAEVALALVLLVGAGLLIRTALYLGRIDPGFDATGVMTGQVSLPAASYGDWDRVTASFERLTQDLRAQPGVKFAALASQVPLGPGGNSNGLVPEGRPLGMESAINAQMRLVTPGYLAAMKIPLRGRDFSVVDRRTTSLVVIVSARLAAVAWPGQDPIGKRLVCCEGTPSAPVWKEVVGVAGDVRWNGLDQPAKPEFYLPLSQAPPDAWNWIQRTMTVAVRGDRASALRPAIVAAVRQLDPSIPVHGLATMDERVAGSLAEGRFNTMLLTGLGAIGLLLAAIGIYGVIGFFVARRSREIGIRMALGASRGEVRRLVLRQGLGPVAIGVVGGVAAGLVVTRILTTQLKGVTPYDPLTFAAVSCFLLVVAVVAIIGPARRATLVDPTAAMRQD